MKRTPPTPLFAGFLQGAAIIAYVMFMTWLITSSVLSPLPEPSVFLLLFSFSALLCASIVLTYPLVLLTQKKLKEALIVLGMTILTMGAFLLVWIWYLLSTVGSGGAMMY